MNSLDRHISRAVLRGVLIAMLVLVPLFSLGDLVKELDDVGKGRYGLTDAIVYVALTVPRRAAELASVCALLGTIFALGGLAVRNELIAMRSIGVSVNGVALAAGRAGLVLMVLAAGTVFFVAPALESRAVQGRNVATSSSPALITEDGFWFRSGGDIVRVGSVVQGGTPADVRIYAFDAGWVLRKVTTCSRAVIESTGNWILEDVEERTWLKDGTTRTEHVPSLSWAGALSSKDLGRALSLPGGLAAGDLLHQIRTLRERGIDAAPYELALWRRISIPLSTAVMVLLGVPFVFGRMRSSSQGRRFALGALVGVGFYLLEKVLGYLGLVSAFGPPLGAMSPVALALVAAVFLLRRAR